MSNISRSSVREWLVPARFAGIVPPVLLPILFSAADRRYGSHPVVVHLGGPPPSPQANSAFDPVKRTQSSLACELNVRAVDGHDTTEARRLNRNLRDLQAMHIEHCKRLLRELGR